jgi:hypothetical protein
MLSEEQVVNSSRTLGALCFKGARRCYSGGTVDVPQMAEDLLRRPGRQPWAKRRSDSPPRLQSPARPPSLQIVLDPDRPVMKLLCPGMSVIATIDTRVAGWTLTG